MPVQAVPPDTQLEDDLVQFVVQSILRTRLALVTCDSLRRRVQLLGKEAPELADQATTRVGWESLWISVTSLVSQEVPLLDFRGHLDRVLLGVARFRADPQLSSPASRSSVPAS